MTPWAGVACPPASLSERVEAALRVFPGSESPEDINAVSSGEGEAPIVEYQQWVSRLPAEAEGD